MGGFMNKILVIVMVILLGIEVIRFILFYKEVKC